MTVSQNESGRDCGLHFGFVRTCAVEMDMDISQGNFCANRRREKLGQNRKNPSTWTHARGRAIFVFSWFFSFCFSQNLNAPQFPIYFDIQEEKRLYISQLWTLLGVHSHLSQYLPIQSQSFILFYLYLIWSIIVTMV